MDLSEMERQYEPYHKAAEYEWDKQYNSFDTNQN